jgi:hypothetical protein
MPPNTTNKNLISPANGSFNNDWDQPLALNWTGIDTAFGGISQIGVTGVVAPSNVISLSQYQPPNIVFSGVLSANINYVIPMGVGGIWTVWNTTSGSFTLKFGSPSGQLITLTPGLRTLIVVDSLGNVQLADNNAIFTAESFAAAADTVVLSTAETFATNAATTAANTAQSNAQTFSANASNLSSGTVPNAQLPNVGIGPGVIIQADPGGTPTGPPGTLWLYY